MPSSQAGIRMRSPTPYTQTGATDSRSFAGLTNAIYRFTPFRLSGQERAALHAVGERIRIPAWLDGIEYYRSLLSKV